MFSQVPTKLKGLLDGLEKLDTEDERGGKPNSEAKRAFVPETPSADGEGFEDRVCREMGASLFRYKAFVPFTFFHDVKVGRTFPFRVTTLHLVSRAGCFGLTLSHAAHS